MLRSLSSALLLGLCASGLAADEPKPRTRSISEADAVLAVYREDHGLRSLGETAIIFAAWPDGRVVWSGDRVAGGAPYRAGQIEPKKVTDLLAQFEKDGLFADKELNDPHVGPDSQFITVLVKSGKQQVKMESWHELFEESGKTVVSDRGVSALEGGRRRLDVLRKAPADYLFYRFAWSETRGKLADLIPAESAVTTGKPVKEAGVLSWQEPATPPKPAPGR
jgi:hypothetical protein